MKTKIINNWTSTPSLRFHFWRVRFFLKWTFVRSHILLYFLTYFFEM